MSWSLEIRGLALWAGSDRPYGEQELAVEVEQDGAVAGLFFGGDRYGRVD